MTIKKWVALSAVGAALLLIPRRSSRQSATNSEPKNPTTHKEDEHNLDHSKTDK